MASLLANSSLALWVWIIIIVVGSFVILSTLVLIIRLILRRQRQATFIETFGDENLPQRKLTVRRGRVVASSNYLSLTGSKFGLNSFTREADTNSKLTTRSKSPFEWWNGVKDRSHSRSSQVTQTTQTTYDNNSILGSYASPNRHLIYRRSDAAYSNLSLASSVKDDDISTTITESQPASPPVAVRKPPNFSRSFSNKYYGNDFPSRQHTLSRIEELSPHTSMISARHARNASRTSHLRDTFTATPSPLPPSSSLVITPVSASHQRGFSEHIPSTNMSDHDDVFVTPSRSFDLSDTRRMQIQPALSFDRPETPRMSTTSTQKDPYRNAGQDHSQPQSQMTALPATSDTTSLPYWSTRTDLRPVTSNSKKGNVLRKKSLRRSEMLTRFES